MTQHSHKFFTTLKNRAFFSIKYEPSELYQSKLYMEPSPPSVRGCMWQIWLWCGIMTLRSWVCVFTYSFWECDMVRDWPNQHGYWTQQNLLTHVAHLLKLQDIQNSSQTERFIDQVCWIWLLNSTRLEMAHFSPTYDAIFSNKMVWFVRLLYIYL